jgi:hypothetical protein
LVELFEDKRHILGAAWGMRDVGWIRALGVRVTGMAIACFDARLPARRHILLESWGSVLPVQSLESCIAFLKEAKTEFGLGAITR